jgi:hypothetical protein
MWAEDAWNDAITYWNANQNSGLSFMETISEFFNGPQNIECGKVADKNNCNAGTQCTNGYSAAAWLVMESLVLVSDVSNFPGQRVQFLLMVVDERQLLQCASRRRDGNYA